MFNDWSYFQVDRTVSKEKQKSAARNVMHRKRKALTDLFHTLAGLGLSYRAGLVVTQEVDQFTLHSPLNVNAGLAQIDSKWVIPRAKNKF